MDEIARVAYQFVKSVGTLVQSLDAQVRKTIQIFIILAAC